MWHMIQNHWRDVLEILILTVGIYYMFRFVRGTRGAPVVTGFLVVLLAFVLVSFLLNLKELQYLLGAFSAAFVVAILVIFQPELRRMLAELGNLPLFTTAHEQRENIEVSNQTSFRKLSNRGLSSIARPAPKCSKPSFFPITPSTMVALSLKGTASPWP